MRHINGHEQPQVQDKLTPEIFQHLEHHIRGDSEVKKAASKSGEHVVVSVEWEDLDDAERMEEAVPRILHSAPGIKREHLTG